MQFKLNPYIKMTYMLNAVAQTANGTRERVHYPIKPDEIYDTKDFIDKTPNIEDLIENTISFIPYSSKNIEDVKNSGGTYTLKGCRSCGGAIKQIKLSVFEVI